MFQDRTAKLVVLLLLCGMPGPALAQEVCTGQNCLPSQDDPTTECVGQQCANPAPPAPGPEVECVGDGCFPDAKPPAEDCTGQDCTLSPPGEPQ
jgi:hypothetical protein